MTDTTIGCVPGDAEADAKANAEAIANVYDEVPYPNMTHAETHVRQLEAMAALFGFDAPDIRGARVLELGCAAGWNLVPQALDLPGGEFVGVDLSRAQIESADRLVQTLGIANLEFRAVDVLDIDPTWGQFDYILCHGMYSWVPVPVRDKILAICGQNLAPNGVALVSYNVFPGWHVRGMIRGMMLYHVRNHRGSLEEQAADARGFLELLASQTDAESSYGKVLRKEVELIRWNPDEYVVHEFLEDTNHPIYFSQFVSHAKTHGLQYLAESRFTRMLSSTAKADYRRFLAGRSLLEHEQYLDFLTNRSFRKTLLCRSGCAIDRQVGPATMRRFHFALRVEMSEVDSMEDRIGKGVVLQLHSRRPGAIGFVELVDAVGGESNASDDAVAEILLALFTAGVVDVFVHPPRVATTAGESPAASPFARWQAMEGPWVTTGLHEFVDVDAIGRRLLPRLDGTNDRNALVDALEADLRSGRLSCEPTNGQGPQRSDLQTIVDTVLRRFREQGLLVD